MLRNPDWTFKELKQALIEKFSKIGSKIDHNKVILTDDKNFEF